MVIWEVKKKGRKTLQKNLEEFAKRCVYVGIPKSVGKNKRSKQGKNIFNMCMLAWQNEFGNIFTLKKDIFIPTPFGIHKGIVLKKGRTVKIPARPFLRPLYTNVLNFNKLRQGVLTDISLLTTRGNGWTVKRTWTDIGKLAQEIIQYNILNMQEPRNSSLTVAKKGYNDPLIETGQLFDSIKFKVQKLF